MILRRFFLKEREFKMIWEVSKDGKKSYLAGTAHFFPYNFRKSLSRYIGNAGTVLLEGPLDENNMDKVIEQGAKKDIDSPIEDRLDAGTIKKINRLEYTVTTQSYYGMYVATFGQSPDKSLFQQIKNQRPWMAFFNIWFYYRSKRGWGYKMDLDALNIARELGKDVHFLEKIEEQIEALNGIPVERIANFLKKIDRWDGYARRYVKHYLRGDLDNLLSFATEFPTFCESIIDKRDPILYERMMPFLERGDAMVFVGITHIAGIQKRLLNDGYNIQKVYT